MNQVPFELLEILRIRGSEPLLSAQRYMELLELDVAIFASNAGVNAQGGGSTLTRLTSSSTCVTTFERFLLRMTRPAAAGARPAVL